MLPEVAYAEVEEHRGDRERTAWGGHAEGGDHRHAGTERAASITAGLNVTAPAVANTVGLKGCPGELNVGLCKAMSQECGPKESRSSNRKGSNQLGELGSPGALVGQEPQTHDHNPSLGQKWLFCRQTRVKASHDCPPFEREALSSTDSGKFWGLLARSPKVVGLLGVISHQSLCRCPHDPTHPRLCAAQTQP